MIGDHYCRAADTATVLLTPTDGILGTHSFGAGQFKREVEAEVVGAADPVPEVLVGADDDVSRCGP
ncbi:MAG: hypothetical protein ACLPN6_16610 [Streptosporangiaceae bacterium]|jgi:hypothetical protein